MIGIALGDLMHQRHGGAHLADRHRVYPDQAFGSDRFDEAEALRNAPPVIRVAQAAPREPQQQHRQQQTQEPSVGSKHDEGRRFFWNYRTPEQLWQGFYPPRLAPAPA